VVAPMKTPEDDDMSPVLEGIYPAQSNEQPGWGVTSRKIPYYKADGTYVGTVEGGILFDCGKTHTSSRGAMIECTFLQEGIPHDTFFIGRKDAQFFTASYQKLSKSRTQALKGYYALSGKIEARRLELLEKGANQNPHFASARVAHDTFQKHIQDAKQLELQRDKLEGTRRMELEDKLREMKMKESALKKTFEEAQDKFTAWKKTHADSLPQPENDKDIQEWTREKKRLAAALPGLAF
jgi:acetyl/propionyl-CoA carboxylase alpha subunit